MLGRCDLVADAFTAAALDASRWDAAMETAAKAAGAHGAMLFALNGLPIIPRSRSMEAAFNTYVQDGWYTRDVRLNGWRPLERKGYISEPDVIEIDKINKDPYYQELLSPHKLRWFAGIKISSQENMLCLSIQRTVEQGRFSDVEMATLAGLTAALSGPAALARAIGFARAEGAIAGFEASGSSVLLLDGFGNIVRYNASVEKMLGPDLLIRRRRLVSTNKDAQAALERVMHDVIWNTKGNIAARPVTLPRRASLPVIAYVLRLDNLTNNALDLCQACIVLDDFNGRGRPAEAVLRSVFALTGKEARIAAGLSTGAALGDLADEFGISYETARNHLKSIMAKTGTHRQTELVAMLARLRPAQPG